MDTHDERSTSRPHRLSLRKETMLVACSCLLIVCTVLAFITIGGIQRTYAAGSFTQGASSTSATQAQLWFQPSGWTAGYVITHYTVASGAQQNVNMTYNSSTSRWEYTIGGLSTGNTISYSFTYQQSGRNSFFNKFAYNKINPVQTKFVIILVAALVICMSG